jgi:hypothetical protein
VGAGAVRGRILKGLNIRQEVTFFLPGRGIVFITDDIFSWEVNTYVENNGIIHSERGLVSINDYTFCGR